ncbi:MAG: hypothetical protein CMK07_07660 [Ponticaulis sp.]|nr:hypothetical protein [Ponticaulis sp.]
MSSPFQTEQMTLAQLFSGKRTFSFPAFQRPYRWSEEEALTLIDDVAAATLRGDPGYFLGNLVLTEDTETESMVIDGRQRLTTLFMLTCILRDLEPDKARKKALHRLIFDEPADDTETTGWRLSFHPSEQAVIEDRFLKPHTDGTATEGWRSDVADRYLSMFRVADSMRELLEQPTADTGLPRLEDFTDYLLNQCEVIVLTASSATSGLRLFQVLNNRGLQLSEADLIKPDLLQTLSLERQAEAATIWDGLEDKLGAEHLDTLLRSYVFIVTGEWIPPGRNFASSLKAAMMTRGAETFHFEDLPRYGVAFSDIHWGDIPYDEPEQNGNLLIQSMNFLGRTANEWKEFLPVTMEILIRFDGEYEEIYRHISALERAFFVWFINETSEAARRRISYEMIQQLRDGDDLFAANKAFDIPAQELDKAISRLATPFPKLYQRGALIRRMELLLCERAGAAAPRYLELSTAEHILPRNPPSGSQWALDFTPQQRRDYLDLLGNGIPLTRDIDKRVGSRDFNAKKAIYKDSGLANYFRSVGQVCKYSTWTPTDIMERTERLAGLLADRWRSIPKEPVPDDFDDEDAITELPPQTYSDLADAISRQIDDSVKKEDK